MSCHGMACDTLLPLGAGVADVINNQAADVSISSRFCMKLEGHRNKSRVILLDLVPSAAE